ncbi:DNA gyrase subunit A [Pallidibacillus pasinlerensis]|uniref:DNA gyrase subunit A n=1 Tax=Pallidibacillus pasinlerensis TaxID=2703818 RepID=A0ABX0A4E5_9BACI|nr:DNA gyrase subunit A [Pallidibacillus pasinlerensis]NCU18251.1 DNA gyrase subunit A [Pallidibacillus pasinlerensis]
MTETPSSNISEINITEEMRTSFLDYAMSVIVSRALPDVRDGLKPVQRRVLYSMNDLGVTADKPHKKSARIVGDVIGKYHPHGDSAVYETMVRMAQDFNLRYPLIDGHGNFGSIDGDGAAAMRYTEARMSKIAMEMLRDINKDTIDYQDSYDGQEKEPVVLPAKFPNLLVNGTTGIAVGMATNMAPHQLGEVIDGLIALSRNPEISIEELMEYIPGPDFPTGGLILGRSGIRKAYMTGKGSVTVRSKVEIEEIGSGGKQAIVVKEIPYMVNKARLIEKIAELAREKRIDGITALRDESDRFGIRIVMELRRDANPHVLLNNLYKHTSLQTNFSINNLALVNGQPKVLNLKELLYYYLEHQKEVIRRRTAFELRKAEARAHILEGLRIALDHIDAIISLIRSSRTTEIAKEGLMNQFNLSEKQAQAILDMRLQRLTGLEREKIEEEYVELIKLIAELRAILADEEKILDIIRDELSNIKERFNDERRTEITAAVDDIDDEDLIPEENVVITLTKNGYIKRQPSSTYRAQKRGGRGIQGMGTNEDDFVEHIITTSTHNTLLFFTNKGKVYKLKGYRIPEYSRTAKGLPVINLLEIEKDEWINAIIPVEGLDDTSYLFFTTKQGIAKRSLLSSYANIRSSGLIAIHLRDNDELISVKLTDGTKDIAIGTKKGMLIRFNETEVRAMGRTATGVKGITLDEDDEVVDMEILEEDQDVLVVTRKGYGKRTNASEYRVVHRGGKGVRTCNIQEKNGELVAMKSVNGDEDIMIVTDSGVIIRMDVAGISRTGRNTLGVKLIRLADDHFVSAVAKVDKEEEEQEQDEVETEES